MELQLITMYNCITILTSRVDHALFASVEKDLEKIVKLLDSCSRIEKKKKVKKILSTQLVEKKKNNKEYKFLTSRSE